MLRWLLHITTYEDYRWSCEISAKEKAVVTIQNVVATANLKQRLDLDIIARLFPGTEYRPEQFPGLVFRLKKPKTATLLFSSGKMVCTGSKSERQAKRAVTNIAAELKKNGMVIVGRPDIQVQNVVASGGLGGSIDLDKTTYSLKKTQQKRQKR